MYKLKNKYFYKLIFFLSINLYADTSHEVICCNNSNIENQQELIKVLSKDIGLMSDRIGKMADKIGLMADRILVTEKLILNLIESQNKSTNTDLLLISPLNGSFVSVDEAPTIILSNNTKKFILCISKEPMFKRDNTLTLYIDSNDLLNSSWSQIIEFVKTKTMYGFNNDSFVFYIAVKGLTSESKVSNLSNSVQLLVN